MDDQGCPYLQVLQPSLDFWVLGVTNISTFSQLLVGWKSKTVFIGEFDAIGAIDVLVNCAYAVWAWVVWHVILDVALRM